MSTTLTIVGVPYAYPTAGDPPGWGGAATSWASAVTNNALFKSGGSFTLTAEVDFGATYGLKTAYYKTQTANLADAGQFRLANTDVISWRNNANSANLDLGPGTDDILEFNGVDLVDVSSTQTLTNKTFSGPKISGLTTNKVLEVDGSDNVINGETLEGSFYVQPTASPPSTPSEGDQWWDITTDVLSIYDGASWNAVSSDSLAAMNDTTITTPADDDVLQYDSGTGKWLNVTTANMLATGNLTDISDVNIPSPSNSEILTYNSGTSKWVNTSPSTLAGTLDFADLSDTNVSLPLNQHMLYYDSGSSKWVNAQISTIGGFWTLDDIGDVTITGIASGEVLKWNGSAWINNTLAEAGIQSTISYYSESATDNVILGSGVNSGSSTCLVVNTSDPSYGITDAATYSFVQGYQNVLSVATSYNTCVGGRGNTLNGTVSQGGLFNAYGCTISSGSNNTIIGSYDCSISATGSRNVLLASNSGGAITGSTNNSVGMGNAPKVTDSNTLVISSSSTAQVTQVNVTSSTTNATPTDLTGINLTSSTAYIITADIVGRQSGGSNINAYKITFAASRDGANNSTLLGSIVKEIIYEGDPNWDVTGYVDDTTEKVHVRVTGAAATTITWSATMTLTQVG